ncbi:hypothetical protein GCM10010106_04760 [Thermopolyspora flexuosa]|nr:hypothetical protein GCM10010106_04760 [Thermopolyspora flexuosa]
MLGLWTEDGHARARESDRPDPQSAPGDPAGIPGLAESFTARVSGRGAPAPEGAGGPSPVHSRTRRSPPLRPASPTPRAARGGTASAATDSLAMADERVVTGRDAGEGRSAGGGRRPDRR